MRLPGRCATPLRCYSLSIFAWLSWSLNWAILALCDHQDVQARLHQELQSSFGKEPVQANQLSLHAVKSLPYLDAFSKEVLRLYPPVPTTVRVATCNTTIQSETGENVLIPAGVNVAIPILAIQRLERLWGKDAMDFVPQRWLEPRASQDKAALSRDAHQFRYLPFIYGDMSCIGNQFSIAEFKVSLASLWYGLCH